MSIEGIVGMLTNVERKNLPQPPSGFNEPTWSNVKVKKSGTYVYAIYSRKKYDVNYNLDGGRSSEGNILILRSQAEYGSPLELEKEPSKKGYNFVGWKINNRLYNDLKLHNVYSKIWIKSHSLQNVKEYSLSI